MPLDPQIKALLDQIAGLGAPPIWELTPEQARQSFKMMTVMAGPGEDVFSVEDRAVPGPAATCRCGSTAPRSSARCRCCCSSTAAAS